MRHLILIPINLLLLFACLTSYTQTILNNEQFTFNSRVYTLKSETQSNNDFRYKFTLASDKNQEFQLIELKQDVFKVKFFEAMKELLPDSVKKNVESSDLLNSKADNMFFNIVAASITKVDKAPSSGYITFNGEPIVAHDYFEYYGGFGLNKTRLLENVANNSLKLCETRSSLISYYDLLLNFYKSGKGDYARSIERYQSLKDSLDIKFGLKDTKVNRRLLSIQKRRLKRRGFKANELDIIFPEYIVESSFEEICTSLDDTSTKSSSGDKTYALARKRNKYLTVVIENIQHSIAEMQGDIKRQKRLLELETELDNKKNEIQKKDKAYIDAQICRDKLLKLAEPALDEKQNEIVASMRQKTDSLRFLQTAIDSLREVSARNGVGLSISTKYDSLKNIKKNILEIQPDYDKILKRSIEISRTRIKTESINKEALSTKIRALEDKKKNIREKVKIDEIKKQIEESTQRLMESDDTIRSLENLIECPTDLKVSEKNLAEAESSKQIASAEYIKVAASIDQPAAPEGFKINSVQMEFFAGNLKNLMVRGVMTTDGRHLEDSITFFNLYPIPFSVIRDYNYSDQLYSFNYRTSPNNYRYWIHISDVFKYIPKFYTNSEDYSPADTAFMVKVDQKVRVLHKNPVDRLFEARIYSDFVGINSDAPNGLIQTEVNKRIILRPNRRPIIIGKRPFSFSGIFDYVEPYVALTKIENKNKELGLNVLYSGDGSTTLFKGSTSIDILRYSNFNVGAKLNLFVVDFPQTKSSFFIDLGETLYRTSILDSVRTYQTDSLGNPTTYDNPIVKRYNATSLVSYMELTWQIKPDHRFGLSISPRISYFDLKSPNFKPSMGAVTNEKSNLGNPYWMFNLQLNVFVVPSPNAKIFFRANYTSMYDDLRQNFFQAQLGYSFNVLKRKAG